MAENTRTKSTVYVANLDPIVDEPTLHSAFLPFGDIVSVSLPTDDRSNRPPPSLPHHSTAPSSTSIPPESLPQTTITTKITKKPHRGFGYIEFSSPEDAAAAIDNMDQSELFGRVLKVSAAKQSMMKEKGEGLGSRVAVWEQEGWLAKYEVGEEDKLATNTAGGPDSTAGGSAGGGVDPMEGLEGLDVAGPKVKK